MQSKPKPFPDLVLNLQKTPTARIGINAHTYVKLPIPTTAIPALIRRKLPNYYKLTRFFSIAPKIGTVTNYGLQTKRV